MTQLTKEMPKLYRIFALHLQNIQSGRLIFVRELSKNALPPTKLLGTESEIHHRDKWRRTVFHEVIRFKQEEDLREKILRISVIEANAIEIGGQSPLPTALRKSHSHSARLLSITMA